MRESAAVLLLLLSLFNLRVQYSSSFLRVPLINEELLAFVSSHNAFLHTITFAVFVDDEKQSWSGTKRTDTVGCDFGVDAEVVILRIGVTQPDGDHRVSRIVVEHSDDNRQWTQKWIGAVSGAGMRFSRGAPPF